MKHLNKIGGTFVLLSIICIGCKKLVQVPEPKNTITADKTFNNNANANAAVAAIYSVMSLGGSGSTISYSNGYTTVATGVTSDELTTTNGGLTPLYNYIVQKDYFVVGNSFWTPAYYNIYQANAAIENLQNSTGVSDSLKKELTGESKFLRAFSYFYLVNLFGDVPLVTQSAWYNINLMGRTPAPQVYQQIIQDLKDAKATLPKDNSMGKGEPIRANYWAAAALLARVYLYAGDWSDAEANANEVINSGNYSLMSDLNSVFLADSNEAILQLQTLNTGKYATQEGSFFIPISPHTGSSTTYLSTSLLGAFEPGDLRRQSWVDSTIFRGKTYRYPVKYKVRLATVGNITENYTMLRFAEQYLIRAEAKAQQGTDLNSAIDDVNKVRNRAGLISLTYGLSQSAVLAAIAQERRIEFFAEWGHRWFDLKRTNQADAALGQKAGWTSTALLWPIPFSEITRDPNLVQNPGY